MIGSEFAGLIFLGTVAFGVLWFGWYRGFFHWNPNRSWNSFIFLVHVLISFAIYFSIIYFVAPLLISTIRPLFAQNRLSIAVAAWLHFLLSGMTLAGLLLYLCSLNRPLRALVWRDISLVPNYQKDFAFAFYAWCLSLPLVFFLSQLLETLVYLVFNVAKIPEQLAVNFIKMTFHDPLYFFLAIVTIVFFAPLIEEILFRGFLQSFIRKHLGPKQAILITALCFSFFHFSPEQGLGNIPILGSLFALALFLGFVYEKQSSLFASISRHFLFNAISILNLYFLGGMQSPL
jgi:membrane protease YdiL (CAAX protease family)